jgi:hypothetical protein
MALKVASPLFLITIAEFRKKWQKMQVEAGTTPEIFDCQQEHRSMHCLSLKVRF